MTRKLKIYSHANSCDCILPRDVLDALGESSHVRQGSLYVWATTAKEAVQRLAELGLGTNAPRALRVCDYGTAVTLHAVHSWANGTVLAVRLSGGGRVVAITDNFDYIIGDAPRAQRALRVIGELRHGINFHPADILEPVVTDEMVDAARQATLARQDCVYVHETSIRVILAAALRAQRAES